MKINEYVQIKVGRGVPTPVKDRIITGVKNLVVTDNNILIYTITLDNKVTIKNSYEFIPRVEEDNVTIKHQPLLSHIANKLGTTVDNLFIEETGFIIKNKDKPKTSKPKKATKSNKAQIKAK